MALTDRLADRLTDRLTDPAAHRRLRMSVMWLVVGVVMVLALLQALNLAFRYQRVNRATHSRAVVLSHILAEQMRIRVAAADASLRQVIVRSAMIGGPSASPAAWKTLLQTAMAEMNSIAWLSIWDTSGIVRHSTSPALRGVSRRGEFLFTQLAGQADSGLVASTPFRLISEARVLIPIGRRLVGPDGSFQGIVVATLIPQESRDFYRAIDVGRDGAIWVIHQTGVVLLREPAIGDTTRAPARVPDALWRAIAANRTGVLRAVIDSGGPELITAWHTLDQPPISVAVSFGAAEQTQTVRFDTLWSVGLTVLIAAALGVAGRQLLRQIDARATVEQALVRSAQELTEAQRIAGLGAVRFQAPDFVTWPSPQCAGLLDLPVEATSMPVQVLLDRLIEADRPRLRAALASCLATGNRWQLEVRARRADGTERVLWAEGVVEAGANVADATILAVFQDVTKQRGAVQQAVQSERLAAIGRFTGGVAHDFNNLLTVIVGYSQIALARLAADDPMHGEIEEIQSAGTRAADLTRQLLAFSRQQVLEPRVLDLNVTVTQVEKLLRRVIGEDIALATRLDPDLGRIHADPGQLERVLMNLAVNARDAMPGGGTLLVETANVKLDEHFAQTHLGGVQPGPFVRLAVSDTGTGMDAETLAHVFEPFYTTKEQGEGTGLGLATVYGIVKQSGGSVWAYSEPGLGTTIKIYLPRVELPADSTTVAAPAVEPVRATGTILLVEDEPLLRKLARRILEMRGYTVHEAANAPEAIRFSELHAGMIDLMITDVVMPGLSGAELARQMATLRPSMRVLYVSGYTDDAIAQHGILDAGIAFLQKPFTPTSLTRKVLEVMTVG